MDWSAGNKPGSTAARRECCFQAHNCAGNQWGFCTGACHMCSAPRGVPVLLIVVGFASLWAQASADFDACPVQDPNSATYEDLVWVTRRRGAG